MDRASPSSYIDRQLFIILIDCSLPHQFLPRSLDAILPGKAKRAKRKSNETSQCLSLYPKPTRTILNLRKISINPDTDLLAQSPQSSSGAEGGEEEAGWPCCPWAEAAPEREREEEEPAYRRACEAAREQAAPEPGEAEPACWRACEAAREQAALEQVEGEPACWRACEAAPGRAARVPEEEEPACWRVSEAAQEQAAPEREGEDEGRHERRTRAREPAAEGP